MGGGGGREIMEGLLVELRARFRRYGTNGTVQERARSHAQQDYCFPLQFPSVALVFNPILLHDLLLIPTLHPTGFLKNPSLVSNGPSILSSNS